MIENSVYWLSKKDTVKRKKITIKIRLTDDNFESLDYYDSGPGIAKKHIENQIIFEPGFSTKPKGTGLGLSIAGEAADRSKLRLKALEYNDGVYFRLEKKEMNSD